MPPTSLTHPCRLRIFSYNIHQGITARRNRLGLAALKEAIASANPDVVVLQEVAGLLPDSSAKAGPIAACYQLEELATGWPFSIWGKNADFERHCHGNAVLSRFPIVAWHNEDITVGRFERRGLLHATLQVPSIGPVHVLGVHLGLCRNERLEQARLVCRYVARRISLHDTLFLVGDFNDWRRRLSPAFARTLGVEEVAARSVWGAFGLRTYPARFPLFNLDRIYYRGVHLAGSSLPKGRPWNLLSDHLPILADFDCPAVP